MIQKKICLIGDFHVGKTSLIRRFVDRQFSDKYLSTVGVKISRKLVQFQEDHLIENNSNNRANQLQLVIWDLEGNAKFKGITPSYLQGAKGAIIVGDVTRIETIANIESHIDLFFSINKNNSKVIIALNKSDLIEAEEKLYQLNSISDLKKENPHIIDTYLTSAKTGDKVDESFYKLAKAML